MIHDRWDRNLRRLRIDQLSFPKNNLIFKSLAPKKWPELRILVLRPWRDGRSALLWRSRGLYSTDMLGQQLGEEAIATSADFIALEVLKKGLPMLQVLVLGGYWFWISRTHCSRPRVLRFEDARDDPIEAQVMAESLSTHDWNFLLDVSSSEFDAPGYAIPKDRFKRSNYLTVYRKCHQVGRDSSQFRGQQFGQGTTILSACS